MTMTFRPPKTKQDVVSKRAATKVSKEIGVENVDTPPPAPPVASGAPKTIKKSSFRSY